MFLPLAAFLIAAAQAAGPQPVTPPHRLFSVDDFPQAALRENAAGDVAVSLTINLDGRVTGCSVTAGAAHPALNAATCRILTSRSRFQPARDAQGRPVEGTYPTRISWRIPRPEPIPFLPNRHTVTVVIQDGLPVSCTMISLLPHLPALPQGGLACPPSGRKVPPGFLQNGRIYLVAELEPDGTTLAPASIGGTLQGGLTARIQVATDGRVTACQARADGNAQADSGTRLCQAMTAPNTIFAPDGAPTRSARIAWQMYLDPSR